MGRGQSARQGCAFAALCLAAAAGAAQTAGVGNADTKRDYTDAQVLASVARIDLPALPPAAPAAGRGATGPVRMGVHRPVTPAAGELAPRLTWTTLEDGRIVAAVVVASPGAAFVRVALTAKLGNGGELRYFKPGAAPLRHAVVSAAEFARARPGAQGAVLWSPSVPGDSIGVEIVLPSTMALAEFSFVVVKVAHGTVDRDAAAWQPKAYSCPDHVDVRCRTEKFRAGLEDAVARVLYESAGGTYACTGTLLAGAPGSGQALFLTANHCIATAAQAGSAETTWFFQRATCNAPTIDAGVTVHGGAILRATSVAQDATLLALRGALPARVDFADWTRSPPAESAAVIGIHHPGADEKKYAGGALVRSVDAVLGARVVTRDALAVQWDDGLTEGGSSGSGLFHDGALIGVLSGGAGGCQQSGDVYGPFAGFFPRACPWLSPGDVCVDDGNVPLFLAAGDGRRESFARIINHSAKSGSVWISPRDDSGRRFEPVMSPIGANAALHFNSTDLEKGNPSKGIPRGVGAGEGHWRLRVRADVDVEVLAYVRTSQGFVTSMHDVVSARRPSGEYIVPFFNPASNSAQASMLRLVNRREEDALVSIRAVDDAGVGAGPVRLNLLAGEARSVSADQLERGGATLDGALGDGEGKWHLLVTPSHIDVMNLLETPGGKLTNLSTFPAPVSWVAVVRGEPGYRAPFFASALDAAQQGFARLSNYRATSATVSLHAVDDAGRRRGPLAFDLAPGVSRHFNSDDLANGNPAKGISAGFGLGDGHWRLEFEGVPPGVHTLAYARSKDGFVTSMHDVVAGPNKRHEVPFFNPASNTGQVSKLRLVNPTNQRTFVTIVGIDDRGREGTRAVHLRLDAGAARMVTSQQLEAGDAGLTGALGNGSGKWRLHVAADQDIDVVNLLESPTGDIANLSTSARPR